MNWLHRISAGFVFAAGVWASSPLIHHDFEENASGWTGFGTSPAEVRITHDPSLVRHGAGSLLIEYKSSADQPVVAVLPVASSLSGAKSVSFWAMADSPTAAAVVLNEKAGGRYTAIVWLEPLEWQRIELVPEDFILSTGPADPSDPDDKLDLDTVESIGIADATSMLGASVGKSRAPIAIQIHSGLHKLLVDDFEVGTDAPAWNKPRGPFGIDAFDHPCVTWFTLGGADLKIDTSGKAIRGNALEAVYQQMTDGLVAMIRPLPPMDLTGATHIAFDMTSDRLSTFVISLEERNPGQPNGPRYSDSFDVAGGGKVVHCDIALSGLEYDKSSPPDEDKKLDLDRVKRIMLTDITPLITQKEAVNTIRLANLRMVKK